jgi:hypothetical protein
LTRKSQLSSIVSTFSIDEIDEVDERLVKRALTYVRATLTPVEIDEEERVSRKARKGEADGGRPFI